MAKPKKAKKKQEPGDKLMKDATDCEILHYLTSRVQEKQTALEEKAEDMSFDIEGLGDIIDKLDEIAL